MATLLPTNIPQNNNANNENQSIPSLEGDLANIQKARDLQQKAFLKQSTIGSPQNKAQNQIVTPNQDGLRWDYRNAADNDGYFGELADLAKSSALKYYADTVNTWNRFGEGIEKSLGGDGKVGWFLDPNKLYGTDQKVQDVRESQELRDQMAGVKTETREDLTNKLTQAQEQWDRGDYGQALLTGGSQIPRILAESTPERASLVTLPTAANTVAKRAVNNAEQVLEKTGQAPTAIDAATNMVVDSLLLGGERALIGSGLTSVGKNLLGKSKLGQSATGILGSAAGESIQEYGENVTEDYFTQDPNKRNLLDTMQSSENIYGGVLGGLTGGSLRGAGEILSSAAAPIKNKAKQYEQELEDKIQEQSNIQEEEQTKQEDTNFDEILEPKADEPVTKQRWKEVVSKGLKEDASIEEKREALKINDIYEPKTEKEKNLVENIKENLLNDLEQNDIVLGSQEFDNVAEAVLRNSKNGEIAETVSRLEAIGKKNNIENAADILSEKVKKVQNEAIYGETGYKTYSNKAKRALIDNNIKDFNTNVNKLQNFNNSMESKIKTFEEGLKQYEEEIKNTPRNERIPYKTITWGNNNKFTLKGYRDKNGIPRVSESAYDILNLSKSIYNGINDELNVLNNLKEKQQLQEQQKQEPSTETVFDTTTEEDTNVNKEQTIKQPAAEQSLTKEQAEEDAYIQEMEKAEQDALDREKEDIQTEKQTKSSEPTKQEQTKQGAITEEPTKQTETKYTKETKQEDSNKKDLNKQENKEKQTKSKKEDVKSQSKKEDISQKDKIKKYKESIKNSLKNIIINPNTANEEILRNDSPARNIIFDENNNINEDVVFETYKALVDTIAYNSSNLYMPSVNDIARFLNKDVNDISDGIIMFFSENGITATQLADNLGRQIAEGLGYFPTKDTNRLEYARTITDLGNHAIALGIERGYLEINNVPGQTYALITGLEGNYDANINFIRFSKKYREDPKARLDLIGKAKSTIKQIEEETGKKTSIKKGVYYTKPEKTKITKIRNQKVTIAPKEYNDALNKLRDVAFVANKSIIDYILKNKETFKKLLGYKEVDPKDDKKSKLTTEGKNIEIERTIQSLEDFMEESNQDYFYFDYFISKNMRLFIDSNTINPQTNKLHRFLFTPEAFQVYMTKGNPNDEYLFKYALAQAFGFDIDKKTDSNIEAFSNKLIKKGPKALLKDILNGEVGSDEIGHALVAVQALEAYNNAKDGETYLHSLTAETDALTSGFGIKNMQFPIEDKKWRNKVGIFETKINSMNGEIAKDTFFDSYETLGSELEKKYNEIKHSLSNVYDKETKQYKFDKLGSMLIKFLPDFSDKKALRKLVKKPFMVFNYGAGTDSMSTSLASNFTDDILNKLAHGSKETKELYEVLNERFGGNLQNDLRERLPQDIKDKYGNDIYSAINNRFKRSVGSITSEILENSFKNYMKLNESLSNGFNLLYETFNTKFKKELESKGEFITIDEYNDLIKKYKELFPIISSPLSINGLDDGVAIYSEKKEYNGKGVSTPLNKKVAGQSKLRVSSVLKTFDESGAAGSVIPIHSIDGSIMIESVNKDPRGLFIHDAIIYPLNTLTEKVYEYNENMYHLNKNYNIVDELIFSLERAESLLTKEEAFRTHINKGQNDVVYLDDTISILKSFSKHISKGKKELYENMKSFSNMVGPKDSIYYPKKQSKTKELVDKYYNSFTGKIRPMYKDLVNEFEALQGKKIDIKDC